MLKHHAQLVEGNQTAYEFLLKKIAADIGYGIAHQDLATFIFANEKLGIDDAHMIRDALLRNPVAGDHTIVVVYAHTLTESAQNALLKITEEPPVNSYIFLVTDFIPHILPTLRSRFVLANIDGMQSPKPSPLLSAEDFIRSPLAKRLEIAKDIHSGMDKETIAISQVWNFVNDIEKQIHDRIATEAGKGSESSEELHDVLDVLTRSQSHMHAPGNSVKMLLEYLAVRV